jgi:hypothetical protein
VWPLQPQFDSHEGGGGAGVELKLSSASRLRRGGSRTYAASGVVEVEAAHTRSGGGTGTA